jgi:uncharacterized membrane protein YfhO
MSEKKKSKLPRQNANRRSVSRIIKKAQQQEPSEKSGRFAKIGKYISIWEILAFILPILFVGYAFYKTEIHPFGDRQILVTDFWHQYYPFLQLLHEKLQNGGSLLYSWRTGLGTNFLSLMAYYAASPLNLLTVFVSQDNLRDAVTAILLLKFAFAGFFFAKMLRYVFGKNDLSISMFAVMYALCSYMMGYYWNIIWIDTVALFPLVMLGLTALVREGKYRTYVISLALALLSNYYIAYFICLFTVLAFFCLCLYENVGVKKFGKRFALITGSSLLGAGLSSWILIPAYFALQLTHSANNTFPTGIKLYETWQDIVSNMLAFTEPTAKAGLPNLYCGLLPLLLLGVFLLAKNIRLREKITASLLMVFLILSCNIKVLNFIWHGFHFTNMIPYRFSFLFSFVLLVAGYRAYQVLLEEKLRISHWIAMLVTGAIFCVIAYGSTQATGEDGGRDFIWSSALLGIVYLAVIFCRRFIPKKFVQVLLACVLVFEMGSQALTGVKTVGSSSYTSYPANNEDVETLIAQAEELDTSLFSRMELTMWYTLNDPSLYEYNGVSQFSSMANEHISTFARLLGLPASESGNRYYYGNTSPLTNMLLNIRYVIAKDSYNADTFTMEQVAACGKATLYENTMATSIGFMMPEDIALYSFDTTLNAFEQQNAVFTEITGITDELFTKIDVTNVGHQGYDVARNGYGSYAITRQEDAGEESYLKYNYTTLQDGMVYAYMTVTDGDYMDVYYDGNKVHSYNIGRQPYIMPVGSYSEGDVVTLRCNLDEDVETGTATVYFYQLNEDVLEAGYALIADELLALDSFSDTSFSGEVTAKEDGYLYMSVPYEAGWSVYVDGKKAELIPLFDAVCGVKLTAGTHDIEMRYSPEGFIPGVVIGIGCIGVLVALYILERRRAGKSHR